MLNASLEMKAIAHPNDINPFSNRLVAYQTDFIYYNTGFKGDSYSKDGFYFGYVDSFFREWSSKEIGRNLVKIMNPGVYPTNSALVLSMIKCAKLSMRLATKEETETIKTALEVGEAEIGDIEKKLFFRLLDQHIAKLC